MFGLFVFCASVLSEPEKWSSRETALAPEGSSRLMLVWNVAMYSSNIMNVLEGL
jgi:hypothetical protein